jgi:large subunit ribosomal protein L24
MGQLTQRHKTYLKRGDTVRVISGAEKGQVGQILKVLHKSNRVIIERVNMVKRHQKPTATMRQGGIIEKEAPIHISNVQLVIGKDQEPTRIRYEGEGRAKARVAVKTGERID